MEPCLCLPWGSSSGDKGETQWDFPELWYFLLSIHLPQHGANGLCCCHQGSVVVSGRKACLLVPSSSATFSPAMQCLTLVNRALPLKWHVQISKGWEMNLTSSTALPSPPRINWVLWSKSHLPLLVRERETRNAHGSAKFSVLNEDSPKDKLKKTFHVIWHNGKLPPTPLVQSWLGKRVITAQRNP